MAKRYLPLTAAFALVVLLPSDLEADWPPGPHFTSIGNFVGLKPAVPFQPSTAPTPRTTGFQCPDGAEGQTWEIAGHVSGLNPTVVTTGSDGMEVESGDTEEVAQVARDLVPALPAFLRDAFLLRLSQIPTDFQEELAQTLGSLPVKHLDEAAFLVAHLSLEDLTSEAFDPWLLSETPAHIYEAGQAGKDLDHSMLIDRTSEEGGIDWTTVRIKVETEPGVVTEIEVPRDVYYWYVVHPKLDLEPVQLTVPHTGKSGKHPEGATWREYYLFTPDEVTPYTDHFLFLYPEPVTGAELQDWGPSATTVFTGMDAGPLELVRTPTGLAMMEFRIKSGTILATTMPLEKAAAEGKSQLLTNCLYYGNGNDPTIVGSPHLVVMEHNPYGNNALTLALDDLKINYEVKDGAEFAELELQPYTKIIVPSDQPLGLYEAVAGRREDLESWIKTGRVFELHAATLLSEDWSGLAMPGGFTIEPQDGGWASEAVEIGGWPHLVEVIPASDVTWDSQVHSSLSGDRFYDADTFALDKLGWFTSQNLFDNVEEHGKKHPIMIPERSTQAVRILYNHYGNCGELQDVITAAARTSLVPMMNVSNPNEDHVWNEFYSPLDGEWRTFQVSWSDGETIIDHGKGAAEKLTGGGKDISMVQAYRGDGFMMNRTARYSETWTLTLDVTDQAGRALDGALVLVASEAYYADEGGEYPLTIGYYGHTDLDGRFVAELGDAQNFYVRVISSLGTYPPEDNKVAKVASTDETTPGFSVGLDAALDEVAGASLPDLPDSLPLVLPGDQWLRLDVASFGKYLVGTNPLSGDTFNERLGSGTLDVYVLDDEGLIAWLSGQPAQALWGASGIDGDGVVLCGPAPVHGEAHLVFVAPEHLEVGTAFRATLTQTGQPPVDDGSPEPVDIDALSPSKDARDGLEPEIVGDPLAADTEEPSPSRGDCSQGPQVRRHWGLVLLACGMIATWCRRRRTAGPTAAESPGRSSHLFEDSDL